MMQSRFDEGFIIAIALLNPMEIFRVAAISLFDPALTVMGPVAFYILDTFKQTTFVLFSILYPLVLGIAFAFLGYAIFAKKKI